MSDNEQILNLIELFGTMDGACHKQWILDQIARVITKDGYKEWVSQFEDLWDIGIAP